MKIIFLDEVDEYPIDDDSITKKKPITLKKGKIISAHIPADKIPDIEKPEWKPIDRIGEGE